MSEGQWGPPQQQPGHGGRPQQPHQPQQWDRPQPPQQWGGPGPPQAPGALSLVRLHIKGSAFTSSPVTPTVQINGHVVPASYGSNDIPVHPGPTRVDMSAQWMRTYGQASYDAHLQPGQMVELFYAAPWHQFTTGSLGTTPQSRKGLALMVLLVVVLPLLVLLAIIFGALLSG